MLLRSATCAERSARSMRLKDLAAAEKSALALSKRCERLEPCITNTPSSCSRTRA
jgi:hypothetical protein